MMTDVSPLGISLVVLRALRKIEIDIPGSTDEDDDTDRTSDSMQTISLMHSKTAVYSREEMWISFMNWLEIQLD